jgi:hypothetical protein
MGFEAQHLGHLNFEGVGPLRLKVFQVIKLEKQHY